ncbi:hypothetical protein O988_02116 [Pseudogymnoascus sp. VKM F-3808]|nr:hypothetical protein O988_02116 [Pseudogymnoascus sp. VKM F-3808]
MRFGIHGIIDFAMSTGAGAEIEMGGASRRCWGWTIPLWVTGGSTEYRGCGERDLARLKEGSFLSGVLLKLRNGPSRKDCRDGYYTRVPQCLSYSLAGNIGNKCVHAVDLGHRRDGLVDTVFKAARFAGHKQQEYHGMAD